MIIDSSYDPETDTQFIVLAIKGKDWLENTKFLEEGL